MNIPDPALAPFHAPVQSWFTASFAEPTAAQKLAWPLLGAGRTSLILAPTGSGKTLAAFLAAIDLLMFADGPLPPRKERCRVLYVSPLKALAVDVEKNLRAPLVGVARYAERMGHAFHLPEVALRTGDTSARERAAFSSAPADILITTPESLYLLLTSRAREALRSVRCVIIDEIHALLPTKRGAHLMLSLERLAALTRSPPQRIGLSATVAPVEEAARFLGGFDIEGPRSTPRPVAIADARARKFLDLRVEVPVEDMAQIGQALDGSVRTDDIPSGPAASGERRTSIWPAMHPLILSLIRAHRSTLVFVNSRRLAERLAAALNELAAGDEQDPAAPPKEIVKAHHGSIARLTRLEIEDQLKAGTLPALVATSSLELGIDMGAIDLVIQVETPPSVSSGIQRIGRAGHHIGAPSQGVILPKFRGDLLSCAALSERMQRGEVEPHNYPRNALDVLAQQVVAAVAMTTEDDRWKVDDLYAMLRGAAPFSDLPRSLLEGVLDMLSGRYPSDDFAQLRPRLTWDRVAGTLKPREGSLRMAVLNGGTIPDRGLYGVFLPGDGGDDKTSRRVGELDEEMVFESRVGEIFLLGASSWRIEEITHDRVMVSPAPGEPGKMPFWHGDRAGRPLAFGRAIGALCRTLRGLEPEEARRRLVEQHSLSGRAADNLLGYLSEQAAAAELPDDRTLVIERFLDEMGDFRVCLLSPFGSQVHGPWALAIEALWRERGDGPEAGNDIDVMWTDDGIVVRFPESPRPPPDDLLLPDPDEVQDLILRQLGKSALFASRFREAAQRALLLPRRAPGKRTPLWQQRRRAADLLQAASRYDSFPLLLETYRECLRDVFDLPGLVEILREVRKRQLRVVSVQTRRPSPFASSLMFNYVANFIYDGDAPLAERRAQALMVDPAQLRQLLGEVELRELIDPEALEALELQLQHLTEERRARHADGVHDLLLRLGDLSHDELLLRCAGDADAGPAQWIDLLLRERRVLLLKIAGEARYVAAEDAGRFRDALGIPPPPGLPHALLEFVRDPLGDLVARYARTHGPFQVTDLAARFGLGTAPLLQSLMQLESAGKVVQGEFRPLAKPDLAGREFCDTEVLRLLRQKSLSKLRHEVEPVEPAALGRLYVAWQGIGSLSSGPQALLQAIEQLQGAEMPASVLEAEVLPARIKGYDPHELDGLTASGLVIWVGREPLGEKDGRISLYLTEHAALLLPPAPPPAAGNAGPAEAAMAAGPPDLPIHARLRQHLQQRGASFFAQLVQAAGGPGVAPAEVLRALWDLVWSGEVTNDTLAPLRAYLRQRRKGASRRGAARPRLSQSLSIPPEAAGRWSLVRSFVLGEPTATERLTAGTRQLLSRYGVLTREAVTAEGPPGGFSAIYPVLKSMEEAAQVRRGYFVAGRGATQFALPGAVDRLRALREPRPWAGPGPGKDAGDDARAVVLAAADPANPYGAALPWPKPAAPDGDQAQPRGEARRPSRSAGALVVLVDGALAAWMGRGEHQLVSFPMEDGAGGERTAAEVGAAVVRALAAQVRGGRRRTVVVREIDGVKAHQSPLLPALLAAGFVAGYEGFTCRP